jgi:FixJ family two-component response regulator
MKPCIVIVDDDAAVRNSLSAALECEGFCVRTYCSGDHFLEAAPQGEVHCLIVDMHMPDMTGLQIAERLKLENNTTPIILITGNPNSALKVQAKKCGISIVLEKPFRHDVLLQTINAL